MRHLLILFFAIILSGANLNAQLTFEELSSMEIDLGDGDLQHMESFTANLYLFVGEGFDTTDIDMLSEGPMLRMFLLQLAKKANGTITYGALYKEFVEFKQNESYESFRSVYEFTIILESLPADFANWEEDKKLFEKNNVPENVIEEIKQHIEANSDPTKTYKDILSNLEEEEEEISGTTKLEELLINHSAINITERLTQCKEENKPIMLYFTGYACVNCRKMEYSVLSDPNIYNSLYDDFIFLPLYVDDKTDLPVDEQYHSAFLDKSITTVGEKNIDYEMSVFNVNSQPYFVVLNANNEVLIDSKYKPDNSNFSNFLKSGLEAFNK